MKSVKNVLLASSMLILSATVFAGAAVYGNYGVHSNRQVIKTQAVETKGEAYSLALEKADQLKTKSGSELSDEFALSLGSFKEKNSVTLDEGTYITVQESMNDQGAISYTGQVNVTYRYSKAN
jgi:hypothetical protein